ncbi:MAG: NAD-glutamate dehydrogenase [Actinobacteria bacterium]|nr:NAD-glutamate dehydrogenase [Actinomycetota bacterium]
MPTTPTDRDRDEGEPAPDGAPGRAGAPPDTAGAAGAAQPRASADAAGGRDGGRDGGVEIAVREAARRAGLAPEVLGAFALAVLRRAEPASDRAAPLVADAVIDAFRFADARRAGEGGEEVAARICGSGAVALDGQRATGTMIDIACEDRPFIVSSLTEELHRLRLRVARLVRASYGAVRAGTGHLVEVRPARGADRIESFVQIELERRLDARRAEDVLGHVRRVLGQVFVATGDHDAMRNLVGEAVRTTRAYAAERFPPDEVAEALALADWLLDGNAVLLGTCRFPVVEGRPGPATPESRLGILRDPGAPGALVEPPGAVGGQVFDVSPTPVISSVHRQVPVQRFDVALVGRGGGVEAIGRLVGVFSRRAELAPVQAIPLLRWKLERLLELEDAVSGSFDEQAVVGLFQALPRDQLFPGSVEELHRTVRRLLSDERDHRVRVLLAPEPGAGAVSVLITMPSELYTRTLRERVEAFLLAQLDGERVEVELSMGAAADTVARFLVHLPSGVEPPDSLDALAREVRLLCRTWEQRLAGALERSAGERAGRLSATWAGRFPQAYQDGVDPEEAARDVVDLDAVTTGADGDEDAARAGERDAGAHSRLRFRLGAAPGGDGAGRLTVASDRPVALSRFLPILESLGLWVDDEQHWIVGDPDEDVCGHLHRFSVRDAGGGVLDVEADAGRLAEASLALWRGDADIDRLNRLVLRAGLGWRDVAVLRAYRRYRAQIDARYNEGYVDDVLVEHADIAALIVELFHARNDPHSDIRSRVEVLAAEVFEACDRLQRLDHDRILRGMAGTVEATVRTNHRLRPDGPLVLKLDSRRVPDAPAPVPFREIFVHGAAVEGVHLRFGPVARGGIRASDRPQDLRTEVLDLARTQVLKNAMIVPTGAKGGFVRRGPLATAEDRAGAVRTAYAQFVGGLLDVTDDLTPSGVRAVPGRWDGDDPYLVVAADKGTASLSDLANEIAMDRGFWLGDAFASGGSNGYDHKALGITARGAWVQVSRHFRELGVDVGTEPFTVAGVGDMSGDVFGNGMLRSDRIVLVAAFDHRDVFVDPDPDPARSFAERARLFAMPTSSWQDYDRSLLSEGGAVFSRTAKQVGLSRQVRDLLRIDAATLTPAELISAILRAPVDLLYLGGIGTYVRASTEDDARIDDRANAEVRVPASLLRARVVAEGANLGFTQRARIEYARRGGRINTDAVDNAAGVDCSDREVNLKILLDLAVVDGRIDVNERNRLLGDHADEVVDAVLTDCADQGDGLTRARDDSATDLDAYEAVQLALVTAGLLAPVIEALPSAAEYAARREAGAGLTRPELAVLLAGVKRQVKEALLASDLPDDPAARSALVAYFPGPLAERFDDLLDRHRLRRELIASEIANDLVDHLGITAAFRLLDESGGTPVDVAAAYWVARSVVDGPRWWALLSRHGGGAVASPDAGADGPTGAEVVGRLLEAVTRHELSLRRRAPAGGHDLAARIAEDHPAFEALLGTARQRERPDRASARVRLAEQLVATGLPPGVADQLALLDSLHVVPDVAALARDAGWPPDEVLAAFGELSDRLGVDRLVERTDALPAAGAWGRAARRGLVDDLRESRRLATRQALAGAARGAQDRAAGGGSAAGTADANGAGGAGGAGGTDEAPTPATDGFAAAQRWLDARADRVRAIDDLRRRAESERTSQLEALSVAVRAVRRAVEAA